MKKWGRQGTVLCLISTHHRYSIDTISLADIASAILESVLIDGFANPGSIFESSFGECRLLLWK